MRYSVKALRDAGLEARWTRTRSGAPIIAARASAKSRWYLVNVTMWSAMKQEGVLPAFERFTLLGDVFSVSQ